MELCEHPFSEGFLNTFEVDLRESTHSNHFDYLRP